MLLLNINRKASFGESIGTITSFDFCDLERPMSRSFRFRRLLSHTGATLHVLPLNNK